MIYLVCVMETLPLYETIVCFLLVQFNLLLLFLLIGVIFSKDFSALVSLDFYWFLKFKNQNHIL